MEYIKVIVKTNAEESSIKKHSNHYEAKIKARPENNKANLELIKLINRRFKKKARIISGFRSREKLILLY